MKAVVFAGTRRVEVREVPNAVLEEPTDVVLRVTSSAICGTDLRMYGGRTGAGPRARRHHRRIRREGPGPGLAVHQCVTGPPPC